MALWFPRTASTLGAVHILAGRPDEARALLEEALEQTIARDIMHQRSLIVIWLGEAALGAGCLTEAARLGEQALLLARANDERGHEAWALRLLGEIAERSNPADPGRSAGHYAQALALAGRLGMRPVVAHCLAVLGTLGDPAIPPGRRRARLERAMAMFREMGMEWWLAKPASALTTAVRGEERGGL